MRTSIEPPRKLPFSFYAYSGQRDVLEQIVSLRSFLRHIGEPRHFTVVSDGTLSDEHRRLLEANHPCVRCIEVNSLLPRVPDAKRGLIEEKLGDFVLKNKFLLLLAISSDYEFAEARDRRHNEDSKDADGVVYGDSDLLFFGRSALTPMLDFRDRLFFLPDCASSLDAKLLRSEQETLNSVNSGFCLFGRAPDWTKSLERLRSFDGMPIHFTEQTLVHLMMHQNNAEPLPREAYLLTLRDEFHPGDLAQNSNVVMRHYVGPVRHKMWLQHASFYN